MQYFYPDHRNIGGRCMITSQARNHRVSLQQITNKQCITFRSPPKKITPLKLDLDLDQLNKQRKRLKEIQQAPPHTDRPGLFFRRLPSPQRVVLLKLLRRSPLQYPSAKKKQQNVWKIVRKLSKAEQYILPHYQTGRDKQLSLIPEYSLGIDWNKLLDEIEQRQTLSKEYLQDISVRYQICSEIDYAVLIRILMQTFPTMTQKELVDIFAEIIESLEQ